VSIFSDAADKITADTPEFQRLADELARAHAEYGENPSEGAAARLADAVIVFGAHAHKMNAYLLPALEALEALAPPRRKGRR
jgi:hypothetical protein